ncbi:MAG: phosphoglycerate kinase, partial [Burkholderiales bacterium]|nr:phosphoglycerate kinase [Burkholderiales bacterium]
VVDELRLTPVAARLADLLDRPVTKLDDCVGEGVQQAVAEAQPGDVILLENVRFHA